MFIGRNPDTTIYGLWTVQQWKGQEELPDNDPQVLAFLVPKPVPKSAALTDIIAVLSPIQQAAITAAVALKPML